MSAGQFNQNLKFVVFIKLILKRTPIWSNLIWLKDSAAEFENGLHFQK